MQISWITCHQWEEIDHHLGKMFKIVDDPSPELLRRQAWTFWKTSQRRSRSAGQQEKPTTINFVNLAKAENCNSNRARPLPLTSYTRPFRPSEAILVPWVLKYQSLKVKATCLKWQLGPTKDSNFIRARPAIKQGDKTYYKGLPVHQGLANLADFEKGGSLDIIPGRK